MTLHVPDGGERRHADLVRRAAALIVALIAGTMLAAWIAGLEAATRTDNLAPMSPLACVGFLAAAVGVFTLPRTNPVPAAAGAIACGAGSAGLVDVLFMDGHTVNRWLGVDVRISGLTAVALVLLGSAVVLDGQGWPWTRRLAIVAGALGAAAGMCTAAARAGWWPFSTAAWVMTLFAVAGSTTVVAMAAWRLKEDDRRLTELAIRDPLTGAYNRRHFVAEAQQASARSRRYEEGGAIAVVDLDHFKEINDRWGHAAGDEALVRVYRALRSRLRSSDVLGRIGGDEFAALILHVDPLEAAQVTPLDPSEDVDALIDLADRRMYDEKRLAQEVESGADH